MSGEVMASEQKKKIIKSAQEIFSDKGLASTSVAEIAKKAGVVDSILYHYFQNKEDLLFNAFAEKMIEVTRELKLHLYGIKDPVSKLRKMIWYHLYINDLKPSDTLVLKNLLFECRANKNFYSHNGYSLLQDYTKIMMNILQEGVDVQVFRSGLNMRIVRDLIFGLLDEEALSCFASHEIEDTLPDFEDIMGLVLAIIMNHAESEMALPFDDEDKKGRILRAAEEVFAKKGFYTATISEIAISAKVAEGTIYTYFDNKKDLLFSISKKRLEQFKKEMDEVFDIRDPLRKLRRIIRFQFTIFLSDRNFLKVFLLDNKLNREFYVSSVYPDFLDYVSALERIIEEGMEKGVFKKNINVRLFRNLFIGALSHLTIRWFILEKAKGIDIMQEIDEVISLLCRSVVCL
jgi:AcrR family transcriptional regulator